MTMEEILKIKCPFCGAVLSVRPQPGMDDKTVTCPVCRQKNHFKAFGKPEASSSREQTETQFPDRKAPDGNPTREEHTVIGNINHTIGRLIDHKSRLSYQLKGGRNIVGRKAAKSNAEIGIDTGADRTMSREHLVINVKNVPYKGIVHYASLYKENVNPTFIGDVRLQFGDTVVLNHGDSVRLPGVTLRFEIPDEEATVIK